MHRVSRHVDVWCAVIATVAILAAGIAPAPTWTRLSSVDAQAAPPPNDNLAAATVVAAGASASGSNVAATTEPGEQLYAGSNAMGPYNECYIIPGHIYTHTVWFRIPVSTPGLLTISTANPGTNFDTALAVYRLTTPGAAPSYTNLTRLGCDNNGDALYPPGAATATNLYSSKLRVSVGAGDVFVQLAGIGGAVEGNYELSVQHQPDTFLADLGAFSFEQQFNLQNFGAAQWHESSLPPPPTGPGANPYTAPSGDKSKRSHETRTDANLTFTNLNSTHDYRLSAEVEDGFCDDSFAVLGTDGRQLLSYTDNITDNEVAQQVVVRAHSATVPAALVNLGNGTLTLTFHNTPAGENCTNAAVYNVQLAPPPPPVARVAYVYSTDLSSRDAFTTFLQGRNYQVDQVALANAATFDFTADRAIVVGDDTGSLGSWGTQAAVDHLKAANKPIVGVGEGGYAYFGRLSLAIGWGNGWHAGPQASAIVVDAANPVWTTPNAVPATTNSPVALYSTGSPFVAIFNPTAVAGVTRIGRQTDDAQHYPLISQSGCYFLWGFSNSPATMTQAGKDLFENALLSLQCAGAPIVAGVAQCGDSGPLYGALVELFSGTSFVASTTADSATARYQFFNLAPGNYTVRITKGAITCGGTASTTGDTTLSAPRDLHNHSWFSAYRLDPLQTPGAAAPADEHIFRQGQSAWFKFKVQPGSKVDVKLTGLPANYDLTLFKDIDHAYKALTAPTTTQDLAQLGAEFAPDAYSPDAYSPDAYSPDAYSPDAYSPDAYSPDAYSPDAYSPDAYSPDAYSPDAYSPDAYSPDKPLANVLVADAFPGGEPIDPAAYAGAQTRSLLAVSAFSGTTSEGLIKNTWDNETDFYVRVRGRNGAFSLAAPFHLAVTIFTGSCAQVSPITSGGVLAAAAGGYRTLILTDYSRLVGTPSEISTLKSQLAAFAARPEVNGVVVDVSLDGRVVNARSQADAHPECPYAKNLVASEIKRIVDGYRAANATLNQDGYIVLLGNDGVIPFFRFPDQAGLASEKGYVPPVLDTSASQATLKLGYILGQDRYGARFDIARSDHTFALPELPVGRLVETAADITGLLQAYQATTGGVVATPKSALVTGYDFIADVAGAIQTDLQAGLGAPVDALIEPGKLSPTDPSAWTATDLSAQLLGKRHDVIFLGGHFSAVSALAADYTTRLLTTDVLASSVDLTNSIIFSEGCHSGYNVVDNDSIPNVTLQPDFPQAFARKRATVIAGTGYQYGDTDTIEYGERLYLEFSRQLRAGTGAVPVGKALIAAKRSYLAATPYLKGIHEKTLVESTLYGLPMLSVNMPGQRLSQFDTPLNPTLQDYSTKPGLTLALKRADVTVTPQLTTHSVSLINTSSNQAVTPDATYQSGSDGVVSNPGEPVLPLESENVTVQGTTLRGVGFRSATYTDTQGVRPLTAAASTELRSPHLPFFSRVQYPVRPWTISYFDALRTSPPPATRLMVTPSQFISATPELGTRRDFGQMQFRLFYSSNTTKYGANVPALAAAPAISHVAGVPLSDGDNIQFSVDATGDPSAGLQEVWVTYTAASGPFAGKWQSLDLKQTTPSTHWVGTLPLNGQSASDIRFMVQAVNGVGLVSLDTNLGAYYVPGPDVVPPTAPKQPTILKLVNPPTSAPYREQVTVQAQLLKNGQPLEGETIVFGIGSQRRIEVTDSSGNAKTTLAAMQLPGSYVLSASFDETPDLLGSSAVSPFSIAKRDTTMKLSFVPACGAINATLADTSAAQRLLRDQTVMFVITGSAAPYATASITDFRGRAALDALSPGLPAGGYTVTGNFGTTVNVGGAVVNLTDDRYGGSSASAILSVNPTDVVLTYTGESVNPLGSDLVVSTSVTTGRNLAGAIVCYTVKNSSGAIVAKIAAPVVNGVATVSIPGLPVGVYSVDAVLWGGSAATPGFVLASLGTAVAVFDPNGGFVTGGGWLNSPAGAYPASPTLTGRATFGFVSKYLKGAQTPTGQTQFRFDVADLSFKSTSYDWLVIGGAKAQFKGSGTINGAGDYGFMLTAIDGDLIGGGGLDTFRIKIWQKSTGAIVYDNQLGAGDNADPPTAIAGGSIVIHK